MTSASLASPRWILFGGSFDPPHEGHVGMARLALDAFPEADLSVVPAPAPAGASGTHKTPSATYAQRLAMCRLAFAQLGVRCEVSAMEKTLPAPNYTVNTLEKARHERSNDQLGLLIGEDQLQSFARWHEPERITELAVLIVVGRGGHTPIEPQLPSGTRVIRLSGLPTPAASRAIRAAAARREPIPSGWLTPPVAMYIDHAKLYAQAGAS